MHTLQTGGDARGPQHRASVQCLLKDAAAAQERTEFAETGAAGTAAAAASRRGRVDPREHVLVVHRGSSALHAVSQWVELLFMLSSAA